MLLYSPTNGSRAVSVVLCTTEVHLHLWTLDSSHLACILALLSAFHDDIRYLLIYNASYYGLWNKLEFKEMKDRF